MAVRQSGLPVFPRDDDLLDPRFDQSTRVAHRPVRSHLRS